MIGFFLFFLVVIAGVFALVAGLRYLGALPGSAPDLPGVAREDLRRLEAALTALDARLERVEDQQRFLERLLEERPAPAALPPGSREAEGDAGPTPEPEVERGVDSVLFDVEPEER